MRDFTHCTFPRLLTALLVAATLTTLATLTACDNDGDNDGDDDTDTATDTATTSNDDDAATNTDDDGDTATTSDDDAATTDDVDDDDTATTSNDDDAATTDDVDDDDDTATDTATTSDDDDAATTDDDDDDDNDDANDDDDDDATSTTDDDDIIYTCPDDTMRCLSVGQGFYACFDERGEVPATVTECGAASTCPTGKLSLSDDLGNCFCFDPCTYIAPTPPPSWTCAENRYAEFTTCDCDCGAPDPDCLADLPLNGCPSDGFYECQPSGTCDLIVDGTCDDSRETCADLGEPIGLCTTIDGYPPATAPICYTDGTCDRDRVSATDGDGKCWCFEPCLPEKTVIPDEWQCADEVYAAGDACDCECGAKDPDCDVPSAIRNCPSDAVYACDENAQCAFFTDPECDDPIFACFEVGGEAGACFTRAGNIPATAPRCGPESTCPAEMIPLFDNLSLCYCFEPCVVGYFQLPDTWTCDPENYRGLDGCQCECGAYDPDCRTTGAETFGCPTDAVYRCDVAATCTPYADADCDIPDTICQPFSDVTAACITKEGALPPGTPFCNADRTCDAPNVALFDDFNNCFCLEACVATGDDTGGDTGDDTP